MSTSTTNLFSNTLNPAKEMEYASEDSISKQVDERVEECMNRIKEASENGRFECYCKTDDESVSSKIMSRLEKKDYSVENCSIKAVITWENDYDPFGETLTEVIKKKAVYVNWNKQYKTGVIQSLSNRFFPHKKVYKTCEWGVDRYNIFDSVNEKN